MKPKTGKLIVIEGTDGAGKGTQFELLVNYCKANHVPYATFDFPQYYKTFFGKWIGRFMKGEFGGVTDVPPYIATIPYAADRWQAKDDITYALEQGKLVMANRYATSNAAYQSAKLPVSQRVAFVDWEFEMEYTQFGIPKEDLVIFLHVPFDISQKLIEQKNARKYLGNGSKKDIHESNEQLMKEVEKVYLDFCRKYPHWVKIDCTKNNFMLSKEEIHNQVLDVLRKKKYI
jgi:dTMP kinase